MNYNNVIQTEPHGYLNSRSWNNHAAAATAKFMYFAYAVLFWVWKWYVVSWGLNREECAKAVANNNCCRSRIVEFRANHGVTEWKIKWCLQTSRQENISCLWTPLLFDISIEAYQLDEWQYTMMSHLKNIFDWSCRSCETPPVSCSDSINVKRGEGLSQSNVACQRSPTFDGGMPC